MCVVCGTDNDIHFEHCSVLNDGGQITTYGYSQALGVVEFRDIQPGSGLTPATVPWINGTQVIPTTPVQLQKCMAGCGALLLPLDTAQHQAWHMRIEKALVELQLRTDRRPPNRRRLKPGEAGGT
jgi:hypothetical protein